MSVPKTDALPLGYTPYACPKGGKEKQGSKNERIGELLDRTGRVLGNSLPLSRLQLRYIVT